jgi:NAD(P)-dependent dehydrogenase (short-subunit alcohol dehydrogenase family)
MKNSKWTNEDIPNQSNKVIIITGATSGLGKQATKVLASRNAKVTMAVRNTQKAEVVVKEILKDYPEAKIEISQLDLNSLDSVKSFVETFTKNNKQLDILINNAGVMMCPYSKTKDGFEIQMGVNHLGHFALTGLLMPLLMNTQSSRVVVTSSIAHKTGNINFDDINWESRQYNTNKAYSDSKLANLYFTHELVRKFKGVENAPLFTTAHPGWTKTELDRHSGTAEFLGNILAQKVEMGTLPSLRAATDINAQPGDFFGPKNFFEARGYPVKVKPNKMAKNEENAKKLWNLSEQLTGVKF